MKVKICFCFLVLLTLRAPALAQEEKGLFVDRLEALYCSQESTDSLLEYIDLEGVTEAYLYVSKTWFQDYNVFSDSLINKLKSQNIEVYAVISPSSLEGEKARDYAKYLSEFDGFFFEYEFWHLPIGVRDLKRDVNQIKRSFPNKEYINYIGWPPGVTYYEGLSTLRAMARHSKNFAVHMYRKELDYQYVRNRLTALNQIAGDLRSVIQVRILYSSEPAYMGALLKEKKLDVIQSEFLSNFAQNDFKHLKIKGALLFKASDLVGY